MKRYLTILLLISLSLVFTATASADEEIKAFTTVGTHSWDIPDNVDEVTVLVVGGGGGGGNDDHSGGGGAGGLVYDKDYDIDSKNSIEIYVGDGGSPGSSGADSKFGNITALGGGEGGVDKGDGQSGGSGGGDGRDANTGTSGGGSGLQPSQEGISGSNGYGNSGGGVDGGGWAGAGGGGGANETGSTGYGDGNKCNEIAGNGGDGKYYGDIFNESYGEDGWFAGGGGGSNHGTTDGGNGGKGGGGIGAAEDACNNGANARGPEDGIDGTGGGGGGGNDETGVGSGGSGIILIHYESDFSICDRRGPVNECISNSTHDITNRDFNISSIFQSEESSVFEALSGPATLNLTNSTTISGIWKGNLDIISDNPRIKSGASFRPQGERIIIGK